MSQASKSENREIVGRATLLVLALFISIVFLAMIRNFLMVIFLAGIFSAFMRPLYLRFNGWFKDNRYLASGVTILVVLLAIILPVGGLLGVFTGQAIRVSRTVGPWVQERIAQPDAVSSWVENLPIYEDILPYRDTIIEKAGQLVGTVSSFLIDNLSSATAGTVNFLFLLGVFLYTMFFFFVDGDKLLRRILYCLPLEDEAEERMLARFNSVTRATLKGTAVIGIVQGGLAGFGFWVVGIDSALFWGTIMTVLSIIPLLGTGIVWIPAVIILAAGGHWVSAIGLAAWCGAVVGSADNILRPRLVGRDTQMHDLLIFFSTMGGIFFFGVSGFIVGPIIAALFVTVWDIYGNVFSDLLPSVHGWRPELAGPIAKSDEQPDP